MSTNTLFLLLCKEGTSNRRDSQWFASGLCNIIFQMGALPAHFCFLSCAGLRNVGQDVLAYIWALVGIHLWNLHLCLKSSLFSVKQQLTLAAWLTLPGRPVHTHLVGQPRPPTQSWESGLRPFSSALQLEVSRKPWPLCWSKGSHSVCVGICPSSSATWGREHDKASSPTPVGVPAPFDGRISCQQLEF